MTTIDGLWYLTDTADQCAERAYHGLRETDDEFLEFERFRTVSRDRFRTLAERIRDCGAPYGAHTIVYRPAGDLLLVYHEGVDMWVLPGGEVDPGENFREAAERELREEAGIEAGYQGLAMVTRVEIGCADYSTWGVLPVFAAEARETDPDALEVSDPDGEISTAKWFDTLPEDTRDRAEIEQWREHALAV
jgi:8-oxo-dGTP pyrophosphatase MutT (NUDIX family)